MDRTESLLFLLPGFTPARNRAIATLLRVALRQSSSLPALERVSALSVELIGAPRWLSSQPATAASQPGGWKLDRDTYRFLSS